MACPADGAELKMSERQGVEIDYCPQCRGVWLDRGELDKIIERSDQSFEQLRSSGRPRDSEFSRYYDDDEDDRGYSGYKRGRRRKSWLGEMFEFGD
ncbi:MAG TPA: zf-TFIIB domain-containing protein [Actinomycetota bacterium]|nr:zf-TFIIB domain-containing protein [Actinomycetota bacterium]